MLSKNVETLKNMNGGTAKIAKWYVRIIDPKVIQYGFTAQGKWAEAKKLECILVSKDSSQYMLALVPTLSKHDLLSLFKSFENGITVTAYESDDGRCTNFLHLMADITDSNFCFCTY